VKSILYKCRICGALQMFEGEAPRTDLFHRCNMRDINIGFATQAKQEVLGLCEYVGQMRDAKEATK